MLPLCLIVGSDAFDPAGLQREIDGFGFKPYAVETFSSALGMIRQWQFDAVIVDGDGRAGSLLHALPELRDRSNAPIVVVWSDGAERRQIEALQGGATEVIVKPASARLIAAKLHRLIEIGKDRSAASAEEPRAVVRLGPLRLDPRRAAASVGDAPLALTTGEFELLLLLASRPGEFVHRDTIGRTLGSSSAARDGRRSADMHICRIRKKLRDAGATTLRVETVYGRGYCLRFEAEAGFRDVRFRPSPVVRVGPGQDPR
jgi:DNA-binding response OmpR family regulator